MYINSKYQIKKERYIKLKELYDNNKYDSFIILANEYLDEFPNDVFIRFRRAKVLRSLSKFDASIIDLKYILSIDKNNIYALTELFYLYYYLKKYDNALKLLPQMYEYKIIKGDSLAIAELVIKIHLGMDYNNQKNKRCEYLRNQIINYNREDFIRLVFEHDDPNKQYDNENRISHFNENIDLNYLIECVERNLVNSERVNKCEILDVYYFGVSNIGYDDNSICNYIKVIVVPNTKNIVSLYPVSSVKGNNIPILVYEHDKLLKKDLKVKKLSQTDRFYNRFKRV